MDLNYDNYVDRAEKVIQILKEKKDQRGRQLPLVTTSKLRNLLAMTAGIYNDVLECRENTLPEEITDRIQYLRVRVAYEAGRNGNEDMKRFVEESKIMDYLKNIKNDKKSYVLFSHYMEALVAFQKYYDEKD